MPRPDDELSTARAQHDYAQGYLQAWREFSAHFGSNPELEKRRESMDRQSGEALRVIVRAMRTS